jgi:phenylalanyl-tRNA synthetase beta chain
MKVPISWLKTFVNADMPVQELSDLLTFAGIEVNHVEGTGVYNENVLIGQIKSVEKLDTEKLFHLVRVDVGGGREVTSVSADPSMSGSYAGWKVAVATVGAEIFNPYSGELFTVESKKMFKFNSECSLCSERELGIADRHEGILKLADNAPVGEPASAILKIEADGVADQTLDIEILANITRCQSIRGVAREVAGLADRTFDNSLKTLPLDASLHVAELVPSNEAPDLVKRFLSVYIDNVTVTESPIWLQNRLIHAGVRPINNIVDATNYVMLEFGQPLHCYDEKLLPSPKLGTRLSREGDQLRTLDQEAGDAPREIPAGIILITSDDVPVAAAGIMGGLDTGIREDSTSIVLEAAHFDFISVRKSQQILKMYSEASSRFSRGVNPHATKQASERFLAVLQETCPNLKVRNFGEYNQVDTTKITVSLTATEANDSLGLNLTPQEIADYLQRLEFAVEVDGDDLNVTCPDYRDDVLIAADVVEELIRVVGYDKIVGTMPETALPNHPINRHLMMREDLRDAMARWGLQDVITYSLSCIAQESKLNLNGVAPDFDPATDYVRLKNPNSPNHDLMRRALLPALLQHAGDNLKLSASCAMFEIGLVWHPVAGELLPEEKYHLGISMTGQKNTSHFHDPKPAEYDFFDVKNAVEAMILHLHADGFSIEPAEDVPAFQNGQAAALVREGKVYGHLGKVHPLVAEAYGVKDQAVFAAELDLDAIAALGSQFFKVDPLPAFPSVKIDISILLNKSVDAGLLPQIVASAAEPLVVSSAVFEVYEDGNMPEGHHSVLLRVVMNGQTRTLTQEDANEIRDRLAAKLVAETGGVIR